MTGVEPRSLNQGDTAQQTIVHNDDPSQRRVQTCWKNTKDCCPCVCKPPPYPPLSNREVKLHYCRAAITVAGGLFLEFASIFFLSQPNKDDSDDIGLLAAAGSYYSLISLTVVGIGIREFYKTRISPRQRTQEQLLPSQHPSDA